MIELVKTCEPEVNLYQKEKRNGERRPNKIHSQLVPPFFISFIDEDIPPQGGDVQMIEYSI
jgi:hypothetical protein